MLSKHAAPSGNRVGSQLVSGATASDIIMSSSLCVRDNFALTPSVVEASRFGIASATDLLKRLSIPSQVVTLNSNDQGESAVVVGGWPGV